MEIANRQAWLEILPKDSVGAEIGVMTAQFSDVIIKVAQPKLLYLIDHWTSALPEPRGEARRVNQLQNMRQALTRMLPYIAEGKVRVVCEYSQEAAKQIVDESMDWVYIDAHHTYRGLTEDLIAWYPKIKDRGIIAGHDYHKAEMKRAVKDFMGDMHADNLEVTTDPYPSGRNSPPTFWWVKEPR